MKMSDYFQEVFEVKHNKSFAVQNCHWVTFGEDFHSNCEQDDAIEHAVLNHDRLTSQTCAAVGVQFDCVFMGEKK